MNFAQPALLFGLFATALPVLIHLALRPRPRRVRFPALPFLREYLTAGRRTRTVSNWLLLILRTIFVGLLAVLLARPLSGSAADNSDAAESEAVVILDDSVSTRFAEPSGRTTWDEICDAAGTYVRSRGPRRVMMMRASAPDEPCAPEASTDERLAWIEGVRGLQPRGASLARSLEAAMLRLRSAAAGTGTIAVFTDGAASAWREVPPRLMADASSPAIRIYASAPMPRPNVAILEASSGDRKLPPRSPATGDIVVASRELDAQIELRWREIGAADWARRLVRCRAGGTERIEIAFNAAGAGPHAGEALIDPSDRFPFDQRRYFAWQTAARPRVWMCSHSTGSEDVPGEIIASLLSPAEVAGDDQLVELVRVASPREIVDRLRSQAPLMLILFSGVEVDRTMRDAILRAVEAGMTLVLLPASSKRDAEWPELRSLFAAAPPRREMLSKARIVEFEAGPADAAAPLAAAFRSNRVFERSVFRDVASGVKRLAAFDDGVPAILQRTIGRGEALLLAAGLDATQSDFAANPVALLTWLFDVIDRRIGPPDAVAAMIVDSPSRHRFGALAGEQEVAITRESADAPSMGLEPMRITDGVPALAWPAAQPGVYRIRGRNGANALYVVNWPAGEFDATRIDAGKLAGELGTERVILRELNDASPAAATGMWLEVMLSPAKIIVLALIAAIVIETVVSNRQRAGVVH